MKDCYCSVDTPLQILHLPRPTHAGYLAASLLKGLRPYTINLMLVSGTHPECLDLVLAVVVVVDELIKNDDRADRDAVVQQAEHIDRAIVPGTQQPTLLEVRILTICINSKTLKSDGLYLDLLVTRSLSVRWEFLEVRAATVLEDNSQVRCECPAC